MATPKSISRIFEDYQMRADDFRRTEQAREERDKALHDIDEQIRKIGMKLIACQLDGTSPALPEQRMAQLEAQRNRRIAEMGGRKYLCAKCRDKGVVNGEYCTCLRNSIYREHYGAYDPMKSAVSLDTYDLSYFDDEIIVYGETYTQRRLSKYALEAAQELVSQLPTTDEGLFICGMPGLGKTWLAGAIARSAAERGIDTLFIHAVPMFHMYHLERLGYDVDMSYLETARFLIVDDLGAEPSTANVTQESILKLLTVRSENHLPSVFVTNQEDLQKLYGERVSSRLGSSLFREINMIGADLRAQVRN